MKKGTTRPAFPVCQRCGAMARPGSSHCGCYGASLEGAASISGSPSQWKVSAVRETHPAFGVCGLLSLVLGILAVRAVSLVNLYSFVGLALALAAVVLGAVALGRKKGGRVLAGIGLGLGCFALLVQMLWILMPAFLFF